MLKIYRARKEDGSAPAAIGEPETDHKTFLRFACADGFLSVLELQLEGKRKMTTEEFLRGYRFPTA
jgi:methionyl-tRNA formyltransferase